MKFVGKDDIAAPIDYVFSEISDFDGFQRSALRRGAEIMRTDRLEAPGIGMCWDTAFDLRGRRRELQVTLVEFDRPNGLRFEATSAGLNVTCSIDLVPLSRNRTRMKLDIDLKPQTLSARLLVQSLKLGKANLTKRLNLKVADYAGVIEDKARRLA